MIEGATQLRQKKIIYLFLTAVLCVALSGCHLWTRDTYVSVKPYLVQNDSVENEVISAYSYIEIRDALEMLVEECAQTAVIAVPVFDEGQADMHISTAISYVMKNNPVAAYAVSQIDYEVGINAGEMAIALEISYHYNRGAILQITRVADTVEAVERIEEALQQYDSEITLYIKEYEEQDFLQSVRDFIDENPHLCVEMPQATVGMYPNDGKKRIVNMTFTYRNSREVLRSMKETVQDVFTQLKAEDRTTYTGIYSFLINRHNYILETSVTPSYSLLRYGVGDSKAFATVYAAMCRQMGLDCEVVSGTKNAEAWYWNVIRKENAVYHVDVLRCREYGMFHMLSENQMSGYVWDYSAYSGNNS